METLVATEESITVMTIIIRGKRQLLFIEHLFSYIVVSVI